MGSSFCVWLTGYGKGPLDHVAYNADRQIRVESGFRSGRMMDGYAPVSEDSLVISSEIFWGTREPSLQQKVLELALLSPAQREIFAKICFPFCASLYSCCNKIALNSLIGLWAKLRHCRRKTRNILPTLFLNNEMQSQGTDTGNGKAAVGRDATFLPQVGNWIMGRSVFEPKYYKMEWGLNPYSCLTPETFSGPTLFLSPILTVFNSKF